MDDADANVAIVTCPLCKTTNRIVLSDQPRRVVCGWCCQRVTNPRTVSGDFYKEQELSPVVHKPSEGMRRLGIVLGILGAIGWIFFVADQSKGFVRITDRGWIVFWVGIPVSFGIMNLAIRAIDWVFVGFGRQQKGFQANDDPNSPKDRRAILIVMAFFAIMWWFGDQLHDVVEFVAIVFWVVIGSYLFVDGFLQGRNGEEAQSNIAPQSENATVEDRWREEQRRRSENAVNENAKKLRDDTHYRCSKCGEPSARLQPDGTLQCSRWRCRHREPYPQAVATSNRSRAFD